MPPHLSIFPHPPAKHASPAEHTSYIRARHAHLHQSGLTRPRAPGARVDIASMEPAFDWSRPRAFLHGTFESGLTAGGALVLDRDDLGRVRMLWASYKKGDEVARRVVYEIISTVTTDDNDESREKSVMEMKRADGSTVFSHERGHMESRKWWQSRKSKEEWVDGYLTFPNAQGRGDRKGLIMTTRDWLRPVAPPKKGYVLFQSMRTQFASKGEARRGEEIDD
jgi:hypothetical protein